MANLKGAGVNKETATGAVLCLNDNQIDVFCDWARSLGRIPTSDEVDQKVAEIVIEDRKKEFEKMRKNRID
ncbi:MAG: hypothetical protein K6G90_13980 [Clostridia bacterium]|nr:hypothetical protein [Clostridia bacterium]